MLESLEIGGLFERFANADQSAFLVIAATSFHRLFFFFFFFFFPVCVRARSVVSIDFSKRIEDGRDEGARLVSASKPTRRVVVECSAARKKGSAMKEDMINM